jgi:hypothetical protein
MRKYKVYTVGSTGAPASSAWPIYQAAASMANNSWSPNVPASPWNIAQSGSLTSIVGVSTIDTNSAAYGVRPFHCKWDGNQPSGRASLDWPGRTQWDPVRKQWWFSGGPVAQGLVPAGNNITRYDPALDRFDHWQGATVNSGLWYPNGCAHSFDATDFDPGTRKLYRAIVAHGLNTTDVVCTFDVDAPADSRPPNEVFNFPGADSNNHGRLVCFPDRREAFVFDKYYSVRRFNLDTRAVLSSIPMPTGLAFGGCAIYHKGFIYFNAGTYVGADNLADNRMFSISAQGVVSSQLGPNMPVIMQNNGYGQQYSGSLWGILEDYLYCFHSNGTIYRLYLGVGTNWTWAAYGTIPRNLFPTFDSNGGDGIATTSGRSYLRQSTVGPVIFNETTGAGVFLWIGGLQDSPIPYRTYLWKP